MKALLLSLFLEGLALAPAQAESGFCTAIPRNTANPPVRACEETTNYTIEIQDQRFVYEKSAYRRALSEKIKAWAEEAGLTSDEISTAFIEVWLAVPEINPAGTRIRAAVTTNQRRFVVFLSLQPEEWSVGNNDVGLLLKEKYPQSSGFRVGDWLVKAAPNITETTLIQYLHSHGAMSEESLGYKWWRFSVPVFQEEALMNAVKGDPSTPKNLESIALNPVLEWIASRERAFSFWLTDSINTKAAQDETGREHTK